jgi:RNA ligase (TIGR02306 family)
MRKLVTVEIVTAVKPIPNADKIEVASVRGWEVIVEKDRYQVGDLCLYFEIDSFLPITPESFAVKHGLDILLLRGKNAKTMMVAGKEIQGAVLKTIKLRGQISQGFLQNVGEFAQEPVGTDVSERIGIIKYEPPVPAQLQGMVKGNFPSFIIKTDEERIQNLPDILTQCDLKNMVVTEKLEGTSATFYKWEGTFGVCSRNLEYKETENNVYWKMAKRYNFDQMNEGFAIQGEIVGEGIQSNPYKIRGNDLFVFGVWDIKHQCYLPPEQWESTGVTLNCVPRIDLDTTSVSSIADLLKMADGKSLLNPNTLREGLVFKSYQPYLSFKVISNEYLLGG